MENKEWNFAGKSNFDTSASLEVVKSSKILYYLVFRLPAKFGFEKLSSSLSLGTFSALLLIQALDGNYSMLANTQPLIYLTRHCAYLLFMEKRNVIKPLIFHLLVWFIIALISHAYQTSCGREIQIDPKFRFCHKYKNANQNVIFPWPKKSQVLANFELWSTLQG